MKGVFEFLLFSPVSDWIIFTVSQRLNLFVGENYHFTLSSSSTLFFVFCSSEVFVAAAGFLQPFDPSYPPKTPQIFLQGFQFAHGLKPGVDAGLDR